MTDDPPEGTTVGYTFRVAVGISETVTAALAAVLVPPAPVQVNENVAAAVSGPDPLLPLAPNVPLHPPEALHEVAFVELQVSVVAPPLATDAGLADSVAVGTTLIVTEAVPLAPP